MSNKSKDVLLLKQAYKKLENSLDIVKILKKIKSFENTQLLVLKAYQRVLLPYMKNNVVWLKKDTQDLSMENRSDIINETI